MSVKRLDSANVLSGAANFKVPAGQYGAFMLRFAGTNAGGATTTIANVGRITGTWRGGSFMSVPFADMNLIDNLIGGFTETASAVGAAVAHTCFIPASYVGDGNVFDISDDDDVYISVDLAGVSAANMASGTLQIFGLVQDGAMAYLPRVFAQTTNVAAGGVNPYPITRDNVSHIFVTPMTNVAQLQVIKDNQVHTQALTAEILAASSWETRQEAALLTTNFLIDLVRSRSITEALSDDIRVELTAGAGGVAASDIVDISYQFTPDSLARSKAVLNNKVAIAQTRKLALGKKSAVAVVQSVTGTAPSAV